MGENEVLYSFDSIKNEIIEDLTIELQPIDNNFNAELLENKVKNAIREVIRVRNYPNYYNEDAIYEDVYKFYSNIRDLALYDYHLIGATGQQSHGENGISRSFVDRNTYFKGVIPIARL